MTTLKNHPAIPLTALAAALTAIFAPLAAAEEGEVAGLITPESTIQLGIGHVNNDNLRFGQYSGLNNSGSYGLLDLDIVRRDDATGTWFKVYGRNLGLDSREFRVDHERQGNWGYFLEYSQIPRLNPLIVNTRLTGIDSANQNLTGVAAVRSVELKTERDRLTLGVDKKLPAGFDFQVRFRNEEKNGSRQWGRQGPDLIADPIDYTTQQAEAILSYTGEKLQLSGGYYGSMFTNRNALLDITTGTDIALPPDNEAHQLHLSGGYSFSPATRGTFKVAYGVATQNERFFILPAFSGRADLGGKVETTLVQLGISSRPLPKLSVRADYRFEEKDDRTPFVQYITAAPPGRDGFNLPFSRKSSTAKVEASYQLPMDFRLTGGIDLEKKRRTSLVQRQASWRLENDETSYRLELRRSLSETVNGALSYIHADRGGSAYLVANNNAAADVIDPVHWADRKRDKVRLSLDWQPIDTLSLQFLADEARDFYEGRPLGPESGRASFYSLDGTYTVSEAWQVVGWLSREDTRVHQSTQTSTAATWQARLRNLGDALGLGVRGRPSAKLEVGADFQHSQDASEYKLSGAGSSDLPNITYKLTSLKLFAKYALQPNAGVRVDFIRERSSNNDWTWDGLPYSNGTTVENPSQAVNFIGISGYYSFR